MRAAIIESTRATPPVFHSHVFLGEGHVKSERKTWTVIWLCGAMMVAEIVGGLADDLPALVNHTYAGAVQRHVNSCIMLHGRPSMMLERASPDSG